MEVGDRVLNPKPKSGNCWYYRAMQIQTKKKLHVAN